MKRVAIHDEDGYSLRTASRRRSDDTARSCSGRGAVCVWGGARAIVADLALPHPKGK